MLASQKLNGATFDTDANSVAATGYYQLTFKKEIETLHVVWGAKENTCVVSQGGNAADVFTQESFWSNDQTPAGWKRNYSYAPQGVKVRAITQSGKLCFPLTNIAEHIVKDHAYILVETNQSGDNTSPFINVAFIYGATCSAPTQTLIQGFDAESGMKDVTVVASPPTTYDLSWTEPGKLYTKILPGVPPVGATWYYTVTDKAGNVTVGSLYNPGVLDCGGNDHPDDNYSSATVLSLPSGSLLVISSTQQLPRIAILNHGFAGNAFEMMMQLGEPAMLIDVNFDPVATYAQFKTLIIPSGGLYGLSDSSIFRARLEEYARLGGTIVAFAQQHGDEFQALPGAGVGGYGWTEDNSCFDASLYISQWHPIVSGFDRATLNAHVDGYFIHWPTGTQVLLSRTANGQPGAILYPFGQGYVFATTIYDDWGISDSQSSDEAHILVRDLIAWASRRNDLPVYRPGDTVILSIPITNSSDITATAVQLALVTPARQFALTQTITTTLGPSQAITLPFTTTASLPLGVWLGDITLLNDQVELQTQPSAFGFVVTNPPTATAPNRDLLFNITAPTDHFVPGSIAPFTFHVYNVGDITHTATIRYGLPHHTWESGDAATYGNRDDLSHTLTIPANGEATYTWQVPVFTTDQLWAKLVEANQEVGRVYFAVFPAPAAANIRVAANPTTWFRGSPVNVQVAASSASGASLTGMLELQIADARNQSLQTDVWPITLPSTGETVVTSTFTVPMTISNGSALAATYLRDSQGTIIGAGHAAFDVPASPLVYAATLPKSLVPGATQIVTVNVVNASPAVAVTDADLSLALNDPQGVTTTLGSRAFGLAAGESITFTFPFTTPQPRFGDYTFAFTATDDFGDRSWEERVTSRVCFGAPAANLPGLEIA